MSEEEIMSKQRFRQGEAVEYLRKKGVPIHEALMSGIGTLYLGPPFERNGRNKEFTRRDLDRFAEEYHHRREHNEDAA